MLPDLKEICLNKIKESYSEFTGEYTERLDFELNQIAGLEMENTFLLCYEIAGLINHNKGLIGPSAGLSSGSLVLYLLGVTKVNPMEYDLLFEHFFPIDRIGTVAIGIEVDQDNLSIIRNKLEGNGFQVKNYLIIESRYCKTLEIIVDDNSISIYESAALTEIAKRKPDDFANIPLDDDRVFRRLSDSGKNLDFTELKSGLLAGFDAEQQDFLKQYAPGNITELAQVFAYLEPWCNYDLNSILMRRNGIRDLTRFQSVYFEETNGIYTFPEQVSIMLQGYLGFSKQETQFYQRAMRKKINKLYVISEELFFRRGKEYKYDLIDLEQLWRNMMHYNSSMTDKTRETGKALLVYWWGYANS